MDELALADVDAEVSVLLALLIEEEQVAAAQIGDLHQTGDGALLVGVAWQCDAGLSIAVLHEAAAIESGRARAAEAVGLTDHLCSVACGAVRSPVACPGRCDGLRLLGPGLRRARTTGEGQDADEEKGSHPPNVTAWM